MRSLTPQFKNKLLTFGLRALITAILSIGLLQPAISAVRISGAYTLQSTDASSSIVNTTPDIARLVIPHGLTLPMTIQVSGGSGGISLQTISGDSVVGDGFIDKGTSVLATITAGSGAAQIITITIPGTGSGGGSGGALTASQWPSGSASALAGTETIPVVQSGVAVVATPAQINTYVQGQATAINALPAASAMTANDLVPMWNNGGSVTQKLTGTLLASWVASTLTLPAAANPSGLIGMSAVNGSAATFGRSDGTHAINPAIAPTWTGIHTWSSTDVRHLFNETDGASNEKLWDIDVNNGNWLLRTRTDGDAAGQTVLGFSRGGNGTLVYSAFLQAGSIAISANSAGNGTINAPFTATGDLTASGGNLVAANAGNKLRIKEGTNAAMGTCTLSSGVCTVSTNIVTANSRIFLTAQSLGTVTVGQGLAVSARTASTSFTVTSTSPTDTSVVAWQIVEPSP